MKDLVRNKGAPAEEEREAVDYQHCPGCHAPVHRIDGCNHMNPHCKPDFYLLCGQVAKGNSDHWRIIGLGLGLLSKPDD